MEDPPAWNLLRPLPLLAAAVLGFAVGAIFLSDGTSDRPAGTGDGATPAGDGGSAPRRAFVVPGAPTDALAEPLRAALAAWQAPGPGDGRGAAASEAAFVTIEGLVQRWGTESPDAHPLRGVAWWKAALAATAPRTSDGARGIQRVYPDGEESFTCFLLSVPDGWTPASPPLPALLTVVEFDANPGATLRAHYEPLLQTHLIAAAVLQHPRRHELDPFNSDPSSILRGLDLLRERWPVDLDRVALDGHGRGVAIVETVAATHATRFHGVVHRGPMETSPLVANLSLAAHLLLIPGDAEGPLAEAGRTVRESASELAVVESDGFRTSFLEDAPRINQWIRSLTPRRIADPRQEFTWVGGTIAGAERWGHWFEVDDIPDRGADRSCFVARRIDPARNAILLTTRNVGSLRLLLNDAALDLDRTVAVEVNGTWLAPLEVRRDLDAMRRWAERDRSLIVTADPLIRIPAAARGR